jgi:hypothetical protein
MILTGSASPRVTVRRTPREALRGFLSVLRFILSGLLRLLAVLYWMCLFRRWPKQHELRFFFAGLTSANFISGGAEMLQTNGTAVAQSTAQKAPRTMVSGILGNVTPNALTVNGQPFARGKVFQGTWPAAGDVGRSCELTLVHARGGMFVVSVALAALVVEETPEIPVDAAKPHKPISPKQLEILAERVKERKLEGALAEICKLRFGKKPEDLTSWEAGFVIDFFGKYPASLKRSFPSRQ